MKVIATITSTETRHIEVDAVDYGQGVAEARSKVPEGWQIRGEPVGRCATVREAREAAHAQLVAKRGRM